ncbi:MAG: hypothetical protein PVF22_06655 [Candidatus Aminicenantes bacterium]|jgi:hypothetical protein
MIRCKVINFLFNVFPVKALRGFLIKIHFEKCPDCTESLAEIEETQTLFIPEEKTKDLVNLWPGIKAKLCEVEELKPRPHFWPRWRWALGAAGLTVFLMAGFWLLTGPEGPEMALQSSAEDQLQINYIKVEEKPAGAIVYEPPDSNMVIVWAERTP